jgi:hypothetical protein
VKRGRVVERWVPELLSVGEECKVNLVGTTAKGAENASYYNQE